MLSFTGHQERNAMPRKDNIRDYTVAMFRFYSACGCPNAEQINNLRTQLSTAAILDLVAVDNTLRILALSDEVAVLAVREIYFPLPQRELHKKEISQRVIKFSIDNYVEERTVWRRLKFARQLCAEQRNLNIF